MNNTNYMSQIPFNAGDPELIEEMRKAQQSQGGNFKQLSMACCPHCGYCPSCGRSNQQNPIMNPPFTC